MQSFLDYRYPVHVGLALTLTSMTSDPCVHGPGLGGKGARGHNLVHLQNMVFLSKSF